MKLAPYSYCFLRYYHDVLAGEFANIGVVLWSPEQSYLGHRISPNYGRLSRFFEGFHSEDYPKMVSRISKQFERFEEEICPEPGVQMVLPFDKMPDHARDLATIIVPHDDGALRWSDSAGGMTQDSAAELERLYHHIVERHYEENRTGRNDDTVFKEIYAPAFDNEVVRSHIVTHEVIAPYANKEFKHAWKNGVWNVYEPVSFDLQKEDSIHRKSFHWESQARFLSQAEDKPKLHLLLGQPTSNSMRAAYSKAVDRLYASQCVQIIEEDEAEDFANDLESTIRKAVA